jgi:hypothetical protein
MTFNPTKMVNIITHYGHTTTTRMIVGCDTVAESLAAWVDTFLPGSASLTHVTKREADALDRWRTRSEQMRALDITREFFEANND